MELWRRLTPLYDAGEAKAIVRMVLEERFGFSLTDIVCGKAESLPAEKQAELEQIMQRLEQAEPVQYVLGTTTFCGLTFQVQPGVLIPRPETEELVRWVMRLWQEQSALAGCRLSILDIGTGSGCIAIALANGIKNCQVSAWDISEEALTIARDNAQHVGVQISFARQDILAFNATGDSHWDIIVSNPPYICEKERQAMERNVLAYEPELALFVPDEDPLRFYRTIGLFSMKSLNKEGSLFFEINPLYAHDLEEMLTDMGYQDIESQADSYGKIRMMKATKP